MTRQRARQPGQAGSSRREFLAGLGALAASPFIPILNASGQEALYPKRLILLFTPHGTLMDAWKPSGSELKFTLGPILKPLARHQQKIVVLSGLKMPDVGVGAPHTKGLPLLWTGSKLLEDMTFTRADGSGGMYYGWNSGPSVDQRIAQSLGSQTAYSSLELGVRSGGSNPASRMIYSDAKKPLEPETDPWAAFTRLFAMRSNQQIAERQSAVDIVRAELARIRPRIASGERLKLDAHLDAMNHLEKRLKTKAAACAGPMLATRVDPNKNDNTPQVLESQFDIIASALSCDLTRIASVQYSIGDNDDGIYSWLGITDAGHHTLSHSADSDQAATDKLTKIYTWYAEQFALLLDKLAAIPEGNGTLLDNCMVVWGSELGKGNSHSFAPTPFVVAGGAAGAFATGRYLQYTDVEHNRLLVSICHAMGVTGLDTFGNTDVGKGPLPGLLR